MPDAIAAPTNDGPVHATPDAGASERLSAARIATGSTIAFAALTASVGLVVVIGWAAGLSALTTVLPGLVATKWNAAICFSLLGAALVVGALPATSPRHATAVAVRDALAIGALVIAAATWFEYLSGVDLGIDQLIVHESTNLATPYPGRAPVTIVLALIAASLAILLLGRRWRRFYVSESLAVFVLAVGGTAFLGYVYGAQQLTALASPNRVSFLAAPAMLLLGAALISANPSHAIFRLVVDRGPGGQVARRILPLALFVVPVGALLRLEGERAGLYDTELGLTVMTGFEGALLIVVGIWTAGRVQAVEKVNREAFLYARGLLEASLDPLVTISPAGKITDVNRATEQATGHSREELIGTDFADYFTEPNRARAGYETVLREGLIHNYPLRVRRASGDTMDVLYNATVYRNQKGEMQGVFAAARDVTERLAFEAERDRREAVLREQTGLIESAHDAILVRTLEGAIKFWNAGAERTYGWTPAEAQGQITHELLQTRFPESLAVQHRALMDGGAWEGQLRHITKDGRRVIVQSRQVVERDEAGRPVAVLEINRDVTEEVAGRLRLEESAAELRRSNSDLEQFAYVASHDLQEPLRMVTGFVGLLEKRYSDQLGGEAREYIDFAVEGAHRMQNLINDLLAYSRVGTRGHEFERLDLSEAVERATQNLSVAIGEAHAHVECEALPSVGVDRNQMIQLFQNLIGNAIKFRSEAEPEITIVSQRDGGRWRIGVKDNGIGIAPEHQDQIFVIFRRLHSREAYPGSGIGLAICKKIVERHGGQIWVESAPGHGATFWFTLPDLERSRVGTES